MREGKSQVFSTFEADKNSAGTDHLQLSEVGLFGVLHPFEGDLEP